MRRRFEEKHEVVLSIKPSAILLLEICDHNSGLKG